MSETLALFRYGVTKDRIWILLSISVIAVAHLVVAILAPSLIEFSKDPKGQWVLLIYLTMPVVMIALLIFNFSESSNLTDGGSGYSHWLLRMPIADWKLVSVPIVLKAGISAFLTLSTAAHVYFLDSTITMWGIVHVGLGFLNMNIWLMAATWHPFRSVWRRVIGLCVGAVVFYLGFVATLCATFESRMEPWFDDYVAGPARYFQVIGIVIGVCYAFRAVKLARTNSHGLVSPLAKSSERDEADGRVRNFRSPAMALMGHDLLKSKVLIVRTFLLGYVPAVIIFGCLFPFLIVSMVFAVLTFLYIGYIAGAQVLARTESNAYPTYLIATPLSSACIAWARAATYIGIVLIAMTGLLATSGVWALWPQNRADWTAWALMMAESTGHANAGIQITLAVLMCCFALAAFLTSSVIWTGYTARFWVQLSSIIGYSVGLLIPLGIVLRWFFRQKTWEQAEASALEWVDVLLPYVFVVIAIKVILTGVSIALLRKFRLVAWRHIIQVIVGWFCVTLAFAVVMHFLIPLDYVTLFWLVAYSIALVPLARVLAMPSALHWGRHR